MADMTTRSDGQGIDPAAFRAILGHYPTGVAVVTGIAADGAPAGMVVGSFTSVSLDPPLVAFLPARSSASFAQLRSGDRFCVNVLAADQEALCRRFAGSGARGAGKFEGVGWSPAPGGSPVLDGAVAWIECSYEQVTEAGDHYIVLGRVRELTVARESLPLLFFQGGYGQFSLPSLVTASGPGLFESVRVAEALREEVERCSAGLGACCAVLAVIAREVVTVLEAHPPGSAVPLRVGQRVPHIAPLGAVFLAGADAGPGNPDAGAEAERWGSPLAARDGMAGQPRRILDLVRARGYSISLEPQDTAERLELAAQYSSPQGLPSHDRRIREVIAGSASLYEPELDPAGRYDVHSVSVPVPAPDGRTVVALRISRLPHDVTGEQVMRWVEALKGHAAVAAARLAEAGLA